jgi:hypothetical protein
MVRVPRALVSAPSAVSAIAAQINKLTNLAHFTDEVGDLVEIFVLLLDRHLDLDRHLRFGWW